MILAYISRLTFNLSVPSTILTLANTRTRIIASQSILFPLSLYLEMIYLISDNFLP